MTDEVATRAFHRIGASNAGIEVSEECDFPGNSPFRLGNKYYYFSISYSIFPMYFIEYWAARAALTTAKYAINNASLEPGRLAKFYSDGKALRTMRRAIDHLGRGSKVHQRIAEDDPFARGPPAAANEACAVFADVFENHGLIEGRILSYPETCHRIGGHAVLGSPGLHGITPWGCRLNHRCAWLNWGAAAPSDSHRFRRLC